MKNLTKERIEILKSSVSPQSKEGVRLHRLVSGKPNWRDIEWASEVLNMDYIDWMRDDWEPSVHSSLSGKAKVQMYRYAAFAELRAQIQNTKNVSSRLPLDSFEDLSILDFAKTIRRLAGFQTLRIGARDLKRFMIENAPIQIDRWPTGNSVKTLWYRSQDSWNLAIDSRLPREPYIWSLAHSLKHVVLDEMVSGSACNPKEKLCRDANRFAQEFLFPDDIFRSLVREFTGGQRQVSASDMVHIKVQSGTPLSYRTLIYKAERCRLGNSDELLDVDFARVERQIYGFFDFKKAYRKEAA